MCIKLFSLLIIKVLKREHLEKSSLNLKQCDKGKNEYENLPICIGYIFYPLYYYTLVVCVVY